MVSEKQSTGSGASGSQVPAGGAAPKDAAKAAGEQAGQGRDVGSNLIRQQLEEVAAQKFPGDAARADNFMKEATKTMAKAEREGLVPKPLNRARPHEQEPSRSRDDDRGR